MGGSDLERELLAAIGEWMPGLAGQVQADTLLFQSGQLDSLALFNLVGWVEDRTGVPIDAASFDPVSEWSSVSRILRYIEERRGRA